MANRARDRRDAQLADRCDAHADRTDTLIADLRGGSAGILRRISRDASSDGAWDRAASYEEYAALADHQAAVDQDTSDDDWLRQQLARRGNADLAFTPGTERGR